MKRNAMSLRLPEENNMSWSGPNSSRTNFGKNLTNQRDCQRLLIARVIMEF
jgi:hypothetical protein